MSSFSELQNMKLYKQAATAVDTTIKRLSTKRAGRILTVLFLFLSLFVVTQVIISNWETFQTFEWQIRPIWLLAILILFLLDLLAATWAWHLLVVSLAHYKNFRQSAKICWSANLARRIPGPIWYIAGRAILYEKEGVSKKSISLLSTLELAFFFVSGIITTLLTLPFWVLPDQITSRINPLWLFILLLPLSLFLINPRFLQWFWQKLSKESQNIQLLWKDTLNWLFVYILTWVLGAGVLFSAINVIYPLPINQIVELVGIWSLAGSVSLAGALTISFIGLREASLLILLVSLVPSPVALIVAIGIRLIWLIGEMLSAFIAIFL